MTSRRAQDPRSLEVRIRGDGAAAENVTVHKPRTDGGTHTRGRGALHGTDSEPSLPQTGTMQPGARRLRCLRSGSPWLLTERSHVNTRLQLATWGPPAAAITAEGKGQRTATLKGRSERSNALRTGRPPPPSGPRFSACRLCPLAWLSRLATPDSGVCTDTRDESGEILPADESRWGPRRRPENVSGRTTGGEQSWTPSPVPSACRLLGAAATRSPNKEEMKPDASGCLGTHMLNSARRLRLGKKTDFSQSLTFLPQRKRGVFPCVSSIVLDIFMYGTVSVTRS